MRATPLLLALSLAAAAATPAVLVAHPGERGGESSPARDAAQGPKGDRPSGGKDDVKKGKRARGPKGTHHLLRACVVSDATADGVDLSVLGGNRHMRRALDGAGTFTAPLDDATVVRLVGKARVLPAGSTPRRLAKIGTFDDLDAGDSVIVRFRAKRGVGAADLPAAFRVIDRGPSSKCEAPATTPPEEQPPADEQPSL